MISSDLDAIFVTLSDFILYQVRRVVTKFNTDYVQIELISDDSGHDINIAIDRGASTVLDFIAFYPRCRLPALDIYSIRVTANDPVITNFNSVTFFRLQHYTS